MCPHFSSIQTGESQRPPPYSKHGNMRHSLQGKSFVSEGQEIRFTLPVRPALTASAMGGRTRMSTLLRKPTDEREMEKFCDYHRDHGHLTSRCRNLRSLLVSMTRARKLREIVKQAWQQEKEKVSKDPSTPSPSSP